MRHQINNVWQTLQGPQVLNPMEGGWDRVAAEKPRRGRAGRIGSKFNQIP
jgi:hypothetical protein